MGRLLVLLLLIHLGLAFAALVDCLGGERAPERWSRFGWSLVIVFGLFAGPIAWFSYGRPGTKLAMPWSPPDPRRPIPRPLAPDDDPDFLADLERRRGDAGPPPPEPPPRPEPDPGPESTTDPAPEDRNNGTGG
ncbi:MAG: PLD nuclease N-terminal domain-containing protein [Micromonosporaceae bacterium]